MAVGRSLSLFVLAAIAEIGGAWLVWQGVLDLPGGRGADHVGTAVTGRREPR